MRDLPDNFQIDHLRAALSFVKNTDVALDIGAHRGIWSKHMATVFNKVIAFEPNYEMFKLIPDYIEKYNLACGSDSGKCSLQKGKRNTGQTNCIAGDDITMVRLDDYDLKPSFIKIDVEGMEFDVLKGARDIIMDYRPLIMIEENGLGKRYGHADNRASNLLYRWGAKKIMTLHMEPEKDVNILFGWDL